MGADYVVSMYPPPPHTIHPTHIGSAILGESVIVFQRLRIHFNNIVSLLHGTVQSPSKFKRDLLTERASYSLISISAFHDYLGTSSSPLT